MASNREAYTDKEIVRKYASNLKLERAEVYIFEKYKTSIDKCKLLDMGIGGGRTTYHLSKRAREYLGLDFSDEFVKYSKGVYANNSNIKIEWADARDLSAYPESYFDFILFSFNGIDYVAIEDRENILFQFHRVVKPNGILCFSFHNTRNIDRLYSFQLPRNPLKYYSEWLRTKTLEKINGSKEKYKGSDYFMLYDGGEKFTVNTMYVSPEYQKMQLKKAGFRTIEFCETITGKPLSESDFINSDTPWIYVIARKEVK